MAPRPMSALVLAALLLAAPRARAETLRPGPGESLRAVVERARDGDVVEIPPGVFDGPVRIERSITLRGAGGTIDGGGRGQVITVIAPDVIIEGVHARHSGVDLGAFDGCVWTAPTATRVVIRDGRFEECAFGIYVQRSDFARVERNVVRGRTDLRVVDRGNGIHFHDAIFVQIVGNDVAGTRDGLYIGATDQSLIADNVITGARYGVHYMWSHGNRIHGNIVQDSLTGYALMQSDRLRVEGNLALRNRRDGMLLRDGRHNVVANNELRENEQGLFVYNSQRERLVRNLLVHNGVGAKVWGAMVVETAITENAFVGNARQILYVGRRDLVLGEDDPGNYFSDYLGWDQDGDGAGDRPYRVDGLGPALVERFPSAALLLRSPALELLSHLEQRMPLFRTPTVVDRAPRGRPAAEPVGPAWARLHDPGPPASGDPVAWRRARRAGDFTSLGGH